MYLTKSARDFLEKSIENIIFDSTKLYQKIVEFPKVEIVSSKNNIPYIREKIAAEIGQELLKDGILAIEQKKDTRRGMVIFYAKLRVLKLEIFRKKKSCEKKAAQF